MANIKKIYEDAARTNQIYPQTHEKAVIDSNGTTLESKLGMIEDLIQQKQMETGAVPSDLAPTKNSTNWVTSGGVWDVTFIDESQTLSYDEDDCTINAVLNIDGTIETTVTNAYWISQYIPIPSWVKKIVYSGIIGTSSNFAYGYLYDAQKSPLYKLNGEGVIDTEDYSTAAYIIIGLFNTSGVEPSIVMTSDDVINVKQKVVGMEEDLTYDSGSGTQIAGYADLNMDDTATSNYYAWGVVDSVAEHDGTISEVSFCAASSGTIKFMVGVWDETHGYFDIRATHSYTVASTGNQTLAVNIPILKGETLMVNIHDGIKIKHKSYNTQPSGSKKAIKSTDSGETYVKASTLYVYLSWKIDWSYDISVKQQVEANVDAIEQIEAVSSGMSQKIGELEASKNLIQGDDGRVYRLIVNNGVLSVECTTPLNILVLAHSFGAIVTSDNSSVWERGMSSSNIQSDWVSQINSVFNASTVTRVKIVDWEQAWPNPDSTLSGLLDSYLTSSVDAIFIMCGANVPSSQRTQTNAQTNFASLVSYCKTRATNADIYVCSPGYTDENNVFNKGIKAGAESEGATYISTYCTYSDKLANFGDVVYNTSASSYSFVINSNGRVNHPNDIWHLYMANNILSALGYDTLDKYHSITYNTSVTKRGYNRWVAGGHCTVCTFGSEPTASIVDASNNSVSCTVTSLSNVTWDDTPQSVPTYAIHFDMPDSDVTITITE